jgi:RNA polymerase sigma-70 factor (ECF subfamily)
VTDPALIATALMAARPRAMAALLRYFRDLDAAEEAFQEASLKALSRWPDSGPPRDPAAWLILVARNAGIDSLRKDTRLAPLPEDIADEADAESALLDRLDNGRYRDDILRLLFICCHPDLPSTQQVALALRIVSGLSVAQIARAFLVSEAAMEQRITRAKRRIGAGSVPFEPPSVKERAARLGIVAAMLYLVFNEGYSALAEDRERRAPLSEEAIRLVRLLLDLFPGEPEIAGLLALMLLQHARRRARFDTEGEIVLLDEQDRALWDREMITEGLALIEKAIERGRPGPYQIQAAIAALHARAGRAEETDWAGIHALYEALERQNPSPVVTLNRAVALSKLADPEAALALILPLEGPLGGYFHFFGVKGALLSTLGRTDEAREALDRAISLARSVAEASHIRRHLDRLTGSS